MNRSRPAVARLVLLLAVLLAVIFPVVNRSLGDVEVYRAGGRAALSGGNLYGFRNGADGFTYPPFAAAVFAVVAWLPVPVVWVVMAAVSVPALIVVVRLSAPDLVARFKQGDVSAAVLLGGLVLAQPVTATMRWGQVDLVLAALVLVDLLVLRRGCLIGIATAFKLTPGLFIIFLLLTGRRREALTATATFAGTIGLGWCVLPGASTQFWLHEIAAGSGVGGFDHPNNQSIRGTCEQLLGPATGTAVWLVLVPPVLVAGLALARRTATDGRDVVSIGVVGVTMCLISPVSWTHHWVWVVPLLAGLAHAPEAGRLARNAGYALVTLWTFIRPEWIEPGALRPMNTGYVLAALAAGVIASAHHLLRLYLYATLSRGPSQQICTDTGQAWAFGVARPTRPPRSDCSMGRPAAAWTRTAYILTAVGNLAAAEPVLEHKPASGAPGRSPLPPRPRRNLQHANRVLDCPPQSPHQ